MLTLLQAGSSCKWVNDSQNLLLEHFDAICDSPSQIYHSALPFCPSSSWLHECYATELSHEVRVIKGLPTGWGKCSHTIRMGSYPLALTCWKDTIAVGLASGDIVILDEITGIQTAILSQHNYSVSSVAFLPDGTSLVSGSHDSTIKLWDVQTGGVIKTFHHASHVFSVSISADCSMIASGSSDKTIRLWHIQTEECHNIIQQQSEVNHVWFSPTDPRYLISVSGHKAWHWDINGCQTKPAHNGSYIAFSLDGTQFVSCQGRNVVVQNSDSGETIAKFHMVDGSAECCCFSPDDRLIVVTAGHTAYVWNTASPQPHLIETFVGHTNDITSLTFSSPSSLISSSNDRSIKFWQVGTPQTNPVMTDLEPTALNLAQIRSVTLCAEDGIAISSDSEGVVRTWDISTGICKASFQTPAKYPKRSDVQQINSRLIFVWYEGGEINIWDVEKGKLIQKVDVILDDDNDDNEDDDSDGDDDNDDDDYDDDDYDDDGDEDVDNDDTNIDENEIGDDNDDSYDHHHVVDVKISGNGFNIFCLTWTTIQAWSTQTGDILCKMELEFPDHNRFLTLDGSRVWVHSPLSEPLGWDFKTPGSPPVQLPDAALPHPNSTTLLDIEDSRIKDTATGKVIFQLAGRFAKPVNSQWDGRYLVAGYQSGEMLILDFNYLFPQ